MSTFHIDDKKLTHNPFVVPDGYFEDFSNRLMQQIAQLPIRTERPQMRIVHWIPWLGVACVAVLAVLFANSSQSLHIDDQQSAATTEQSATFANNASAEDELYEYFKQNDLTELDAYEYDK